MLCLVVWFVLLCVWCDMFGVVLVICLRFAVWHECIGLVWVFVVLNLLLVFTTGVAYCGCCA